MSQLSLPFSLPDNETFASFYPGGNGVLLAAIEHSLQEPQDCAVYVWARQGAGRSHLLHAACTEKALKGDAVAYIPLNKYRQLVPAIFEGMEQLSVVCIDNIDAIAGTETWEVAVFDLYNRIREVGRTKLFITGTAAPRELGIHLPDLVSRLEWGQVYRLSGLSDDEKLHALQLRAKLRGFDLPEDVGRFLLKRLDREMRTLFETLDHLDHASINAKRKLTIPFVKEALSL